jgi:hypothetical protein
MAMRCTNTALGCDACTKGGVGLWGNGVILFFVRSLRVEPRRGVLVLLTQRGPQPGATLATQVTVIGEFVSRHLQGNWKFLKTSQVFRRRSDSMESTPKVWKKASVKTARGR